MPLNVRFFFRAFLSKSSFAIAKRQPRILHRTDYFLFCVLFTVRYVFFAIVWVCTWGKHHFWLLPNLTEECGFFESFVPLYTHEYMGNKEEDKPAENENENVDEKDDEKEEGEGKKEESSEDKDHTEKEPWVKLTEEEVATARSEVDKEVKASDETLATEVKC